MRARMAGSCETTKDAEVVRGREVDEELPMERDWAIG